MNAITTPKIIQVLVVIFIFPFPDASSSIGFGVVLSATQKNNTHVCIQKKKICFVCQRFSLSIYFHGRIIGHPDTPGRN